ncbi:hypothetical protein AMTR_s00037p00162040 [Amborella trichopoda]|uniref:Uncharacterized protein n=1 Tax=Amborella trichopoda TaxID=13333 RepID=U5D4I9_AMBTC|nr:hypothetical protein AMTR_s00037p00162040 [Amborella trichopoda]
MVLRDHKVLLGELGCKGWNRSFWLQKLYSVEEILAKLIILLKLHQGAAAAISMTCMDTMAKRFLLFQKVSHRRRERAMRVPMEDQGLPIMVIDCNEGVDV